MELMQKSSAQEVNSCNSCRRGQLMQLMQESSTQLMQKSSAQLMQKSSALLISAYGMHDANSNTFMLIYSHAYILT